MCDFFHSWRRKTGIAVALPAMLITLLWCVSLRNEFGLSIGIPNSFMLYSSGHNGLICIGFIQGRFGDNPNVWYFIPPTNDWNLDSQMFEEVCWLLRSPDLGCFCLYDSTVINVGVDVSMSLIAIPLTLLSAYLLLWPGKRRERQAATCPQTAPAT